MSKCVFLFIKKRHTRTSRNPSSVNLSIRMNSRSMASFEAFRRKVLNDEREEQQRIRQRNLNVAEGQITELEHNQQSNDTRPLLTEAGVTEMTSLLECLICKEIVFGPVVGVNCGHLFCETCLVLDRTVPQHCTYCNTLGKFINDRTIAHITSVLFPSQKLDRSIQQRDDGAARVMFGDWMKTYIEAVEKTIQAAVDARVAERKDEIVATIEALSQQHLETATKLNDTVMQTIGKIKDELLVPHADRPPESTSVPLVLPSDRHPIRVRSTLPTRVHIADDDSDEEQVRYPPPLIPVGRRT